MRVGPKRAAKRDDVRVAVFENALGEVLVHTTSGHDGNVDGVLDGLDHRGPQTHVVVLVHERLHELVGLGVGEVVGAVAERGGPVSVACNADVLSAGLDKRLRIVGSPFRRDAHLGGVELTAVQTAADDEVGAARLADAADDLAHDARSVLDVLATVLVVALVPQGAHEAVQEIAVGDVHLDCVEAAFLQANGRLDLLALRLVDLVNRKASGGMAPRGGNRDLVGGQGRRADGQLAVGAEPAGGADVVKLTDGEAIVLVDRRGELLHAGHELVVVRAQIDTRCRLPKDSRHVDRGQAACGHILIHRQRIAAISGVVEIPAPRGLRRLDHPVLHDEVRGNLDWRKKCFVLVHQNAPHFMRSQFRRGRALADISEGSAKAAQLGVRASVRFPFLGSRHRP